jgi:hypothetical protein
MSISPLDKFLKMAPPPRVRDLATRRAMLDTYVEHFNAQAVGLAQQLRQGQIGVEAWQLAMREEIKQLHRGALILAHGGEASAISFSEWGRLGGNLRGQYQYLYNYAKQFQQSVMSQAAGIGKAYSEKYLAWRSQLYGGAARGAFYNGLAMGMLPQVPGDGQTQCRTNCKCELRFEEGEIEGLLLVFWMVNYEAENCEDCLVLEQEWNPYELQLPIGLSASDWVLWCPRIRGVHAH